MSFEFVEVYRAENLEEAHLLNSRLKRAGINSAVSGDALQSALGGIPVGWTTLPRVYVPAEDEQRARRLIEQIQIQREIGEHDLPQEFRQCSRCGETTRVSFDVCWNCEAPLIVDFNDDIENRPEFHAGLLTSAHNEDFDEPQDNGWQFNSRAALLLILIMSFLSVVCWSALGPIGVAMFIVFTIFANIFSGCVGLAVNRLMRESDARWFGR